MPKPRIKDNAMQLLWTGYTRIYFNAWEEAPNFWSLDQGKGTEEVKATSVMLSECLLGSEVFPLHTEQPRAFFFGDCKVYSTDKGVTVYPYLTL